MAVIGPVGCGKVSFFDYCYYRLLWFLQQSTLLQCLLKELPALNGTVEVKGSVGYASQEAWVFSATMRENILFGLPYHPERYNTVVEACALDKVTKRRSIKLWCTNCISGYRTSPSWWSDFSRRERSNFKRRTKS